MFDFIEDAWDYLTEGLEVIWDFISEGFEYAISFDFLGDLGEVFSGMFEGLSELSILGIVFGLICAGYNYYFRNFMIYPFTKNLDPVMASIMFIGCLIAGFVGGYLIGNYFDKT